MGKKSQKAQASKKEGDKKDRDKHEGKQRRGHSGNAGVVIVGSSSSVPAVLLGGRWYKTREVYEYTDFGGGVDKEERGQPELAAFRECVEELFGTAKEGGPDAQIVASALWEVAQHNLIGGTPLHYPRNNYTMYIVPADCLVRALQKLELIPRSKRGSSEIEFLMAHARLNSELTSLALVSIDAFLKAGLLDGAVKPLSVRNLDGKERFCGQIQLRKVMVGPGASVAVCRDALEVFSAAVGESSMPREPREPVLEEAGLDHQAAIDPEVAAVSEAAEPAFQPESRATAESSRKPYVFDMETEDPDDVLTLLLLASHPGVELRAVTLTPGSQEQVALLQWIFQKLGIKGTRLGAQDWPANKKKGVLEGHFYSSFGRAKGGDPVVERADTVLLECCDDQTTLLTGAPLHNLAAALKHDGFVLGRWVAQGGFAGEGVVPRHLQMDKFVGKATCSTWNFGQNLAAAEAALASANIEHRVLASKNVCHRVVYDASWHEALRLASGRAAAGTLRSKALGLMFEAMDRYLQRKPGGKALHDPLALAVALDESVCELAEVRVFCKEEKWGSKPSQGSGVWISVDYDPEKFLQTLLFECAET